MQFDAFSYPALEQVDRPRGEDARTHAGPRRHADHDPDPVVRRHQGEGAPRREPRDLLRAYRRPEGGRAVVAARRVPAAPARDRRPRPGGRARAQGALLGARRRATSRPTARGSARDACSATATPCTIVSYGSMVTRVLAGGRRARRGRHRGRVVDLRSLSPLDEDLLARCGAGHGPGRGGARGAAHPRDGRRGRRPRDGAGLRLPGSARRARHRLGRAVSARIARGALPARASTGSPPPRGRWWPTDGRAHLRDAGPRRGARGGRDRRVARRRAGDDGRAEPAARRGRDGQGDRGDPVAVRRGRASRARGRRSRRCRSATSLVTFEVAGPGSASRGVRAEQRLHAVAATTPPVRKLAKDPRGRSRDASPARDRGGRVTAEDVQAAAGVTSPATPGGEGDFEVERISIARRTIAERLTAVAGEVPQVTTFRRSTLRRSMSVRRGARGVAAARCSSRRCGGDVPDASGAALELARRARAIHVPQRLPRRDRGGHRARADRARSCTACGSSTVAELDAEIRRLAEAARAGTLTPEELTGGDDRRVSNTGSLRVARPGRRSSTRARRGHDRARRDRGRAPWWSTARSSRGPRARCRSRSTIGVLDGATAGRALTDLVALLQDADRAPETCRDEDRRRCCPRPPRSCTRSAWATT